MTKLIESSYEILEYPRNILKRIEIAARTCYKSEDKITDTSAEKLVRSLIKRGHMAMIEFGGDVSVKFISNRGFCYDDQTEVLTYDGWKKFKDINGNDLFLTLNMDTKEAEYQEKIGITIEDWDDDLICGKSTMVDFAVTPNHRMVWFHYDSRIDKKWKVDQAKEIYGRRVKFKRGLFKEMPDRTLCEDSKYLNLHPQISTIPFAKFMGLFITDGTLWKGKDSGGRVTICQIKESGRIYIKTVLEELGWKYSEKKDGLRINDTKLYKFMRIFFPLDEKKTYTGRIPHFIRHASRKYIQAFLDGAIVGDGNIHKTNGHRIIYTASQKMAGDYQELFMKAGFCASVRIDNRVGRKREIKPGIVIENKVSQYVVSVTDRTDEHLFNKQHWSKAYYKGKVYCVTVPNGTLYVRRNGKAFWSGNTHEMVRHRLCSFAQESTRYCNYGKGKFGKEITVCYPHDIIDMRIPDISNGLRWDIIYKILGSWKKSEEEYLSLIEMGCPAEIAREVLPIGLKAEIVVSANVREWRHIFKLRTSKKAHPRMRELMIPLLSDFKSLMPVVFEDIE